MPVSTWFLQLDPLPNTITLPVARGAFHLILTLVGGHRAQNKTSQLYRDLKEVKNMVEYQEPVSYRTGKKTQNFVLLTSLPFQVLFYICWLGCV